MRKIFVLDTRKEMIEDLETLAVIKSLDGEVDLHCANDKDTFNKLFDTQGQPEMVFLSAKAIVDYENDINCHGVTAAYYGRNKQELMDGAVAGIGTIGIVKNCNDFYAKINKEPRMFENKTQKPETLSKEGMKVADQKDPVIIPDIKENENSTESKKTFNNSPTESSYKQPTEILKNSSFNTSEFEDDELEVMEGEDPLFIEVDDNVQDDINSVEIHDIKDNNTEDEKKPYIQKKVIAANVKTKEEDYIERELKKDLSSGNNKTKVVSVYSAKGGVGKTTVATELATYLSLIDLGKRHVKAVIVDYNIDFGDVRSTLDAKTDRSLTYWATEIMELISKGYNPKDIVYSKKEIEDYLYVDQRSGLYVLPAPITNVDSMNIDSVALEVILDNIIANGEFDYVVCDTGNNTRDSTMIAMEKSDIILMIATQNVNTANCDDAFIKTMKAIDFDLSNVKLVVNWILPEKATRISVQEIIDHYKDFKCVGKLNYNTDVTVATNIGKPLALDPSNAFTKQMKSIVSCVTQMSEFDEDIPKKKKFFGFFSRKK